MSKLEDMIKGMGSKDDLRGTKEDIKGMSSKEYIQELKELVNISFIPHSST